MASSDASSFIISFDLFQRRNRYTHIIENIINGGVMSQSKGLNDLEADFSDFTERLDSLSVAKLRAVCYFPTDNLPIIKSSALKSFRDGLEYIKLLKIAAADGACVGFTRLNAKLPTYYSPGFIERVSCDNLPVVRYNRSSRIPWNTIPLFNTEEMKISKEKRSEEIMCALPFQIQGSRKVSDFISRYRSGRLGILTGHYPTDKDVVKILLPIVKKDTVFGRFISMFGNCEVGDVFKNLNTMFSEKKCLKLQMMKVIGYLARVREADIYSVSDLRMINLFLYNAYLEGNFNVCYID